jgi:hypothetical protein
MAHDMTSDEFFERVTQAAPGMRWEVAEALLPKLDPDERVLVEAWLGDFICALEPPEDGPG